MSAPYQAVRASDGYFVMGATNEKLWHKLCSILSREELLNDPRFTTISLRLANRDVLIQELEETFALKTRAEWTRLLEAAGLPVGPMLSYAESFESEHAKHRQMRLDIEHPIEGTIPNIGFVPKLSATPARVRLAPPLLGQQSDEILKEAGYSDDEIAGLIKKGAFEK